MFAIINDSDEKYFGEAYHTKQGAEARIDELEEDFGKGAFYAKEFDEDLFGDTCDICLKDGNMFFALNNDSEYDYFKCCNCA